MECIFKLNKSKFHNGTIHFLVAVLLVGLCVSGCMGLFLPPSAPRPGILFETGIQPLPENHGWWSKEEVDTVIDAIVTAAKHHGLKKKWAHEGYTLSGKDFVLSLDANFLYDMGGIRHKSPLLVARRKLNIEEERGTISLYIRLISFGSQINPSDRLLVENIWREVLDPLRKKFGERIENKIYKIKR